jgi:alanine racemase
MIKTALNLRQDPAPFYLSSNEERAWAEIDHNLKSLQKFGNPIMAVVKANAYGLGAEMIARTALENGAIGLAVATCEEGAALRQITAAPILVLGYVSVSEASELVLNNLSITVNHPALAYALSKEAQKRKKIINIHLKLETGLNRYALKPEEALEIARLIHHLPNLRLQGIYSHFATGDEGDCSFVEEQTRRFIRARARLKAAGFTWEQEHLCNSASAIQAPSARIGTLRIGLAMPGYHSTEEVANKAKEISLCLKPALTLKSVVARLSWTKEGEGVGYNRTFITGRKTRLALVPLGYADGVPRALSNKGQVLINGQFAPIAGRISMDQFTVDVTDLPQISGGDEVVIIGRQKTAEITLEEVAAQGDTISYEILTGIGQRVKRVYI